MNTSELDLLLEAREAVSSGTGAALREAAGLSQAELARFAAVSNASVSRWEAGKRKPVGDTALRYARALRQLRRRQAAGP